MKRLLMRLPLSAGGIALTLASLGNLLHNIFTQMFSLPVLGSSIHLLCGWLSLLVLLAVFLRFLVGRKMWKMVFSNAVMVGMLATVPMTLTILAGYLPSWGSWIWWTGTGLHVLILLWFTWNFVIRHFALETVLPPWYIVYVGFALGGMSSKNYAPAWYGHIIFWFGLISFLLLFALIALRISRYGLSIMDRPMLCINAAIGICLITYVENYGAPNPWMIGSLDAFSVLIWLWLVVHLWSWLSDPFYPSDAAFSFPFTVAAVASMEAGKGLQKAGIMIMSWNHPLVMVQSLVAVLMLFITVWKFSKHVLDPDYDEMKMAMPPAGQSLSKRK